MQGFFNRCQIGQAQFGLNHFDIRNRVDLARHMNHVVVFKTAHHIHGGIGFADMCQKLVAQPFTGAGSSYQTGDIDKFDDRALNLLRTHNCGQRIQALVWHFHDTHIRLDGTKGVIFCRDARLGQGVEKGRFTDVGQAYDAALQTHDNPSKTQPWSVFDALR